MHLNLDGFVLIFDCYYVVNKERKGSQGPCTKRQMTCAVAGTKNAAGSLDGEVYRSFIQRFNDVYVAW
jgi:hypothetical protein